MESDKLQEKLNRIKLKTYHIHEIYELPYLVEDINDIRINSEPLLLYALFHLPSKTKLFHALLQCGCDMFALNDDGVSAYFLTHIDDSSEIPNETKDIFKLYYPGIWASVDQGNIELVRKSINLWCRVDVKKDGLTLMEFAEERKNVQIISLLKSIFKSISLAHAVLSNELCRLENALRNINMYASIQNGGVNVDIQNLGCLGATPLYFAIQNNNVPMVKCLLDIGANPSRVLTLEDEMEIPIIFITLKKNICFEIYQMTIERVAQFSEISSLRYKSNSLLHCAVENDVELEKLECLLLNSDSKLLCARSNRNCTARDVTKNSNIRDKIDQRMVNNLYDEEFCMDLVSYGYTDFINLLSLSDNPYNLSNLDTLINFSHHIRQFSKHILDANIVGIQKYLVFNYKSEAKKSMKRYLVNCFAISDGQPMLHKAVLKGSIQVVKLLCSVICGTIGKKIDSIFDQYGRTALCYAFLLNTREISDILIQFGASDFVIDYENRSPLSFKDKQSHSKREEFLLYHLKQTYSESEPSLWNQIMPRSYMMPYHQKHTHHENCNDCGAALFKNNNEHNSNENNCEENVDDDDDDDDDDVDEPASICKIT